MRRWQSQPFWIAMVWMTLYGAFVQLKAINAKCVCMQWIALEACSTL